MDASAYFRYPDAATARSDSAMTLLRNASDEDWRKLLAHTSSRRFEAGEWLIQEGSRDDALYFLGAGELEVLMPGGKAGRQGQLAVVRAGSVVGEQSFLDHLPRSTSIRALVAGEAFRLGREAFLVFSAREPVLARDLLLDLGRVVSLRLRDTTRFLAAGR